MNGIWQSRLTSFDSGNVNFEVVRTYFREPIRSHFDFSALHDSIFNNKA